MPGAREFAEGFGLVKDKIIDGYRLSHVKIEHEMVKRYHEYRYPITLTFEKVKKSADEDRLLSDLETETSKSRIINSHYGNPYKCTISNFRLEKTSEGTLLITAEGHSVRVYS